MKIIRDAQVLLGMLEFGDLNKEVSAKLAETLQTLGDMSEENPKVTYKGNLTLKLDLSVANGMVHINADIATKTPKRPRRSSLYWITEDGGLSTEHPQQHDMFTGPREVAGQGARA